MLWIKLTDRRAVLAVRATARGHDLNTAGETNWISLGDVFSLPDEQLARAIMLKRCSPPGGQYRRR